MARSGMANILVWKLALAIAFVVIVAVLVQESTQQKWGDVFYYCSKEITVQNNVLQHSHKSGLKQSKIKYVHAAKILMRSVSELIKKSKIRSETIEFDQISEDNINHINKCRDNQNLNRTYEQLLGMLQEGKYVFCADMFAKKVELPWNEQQKHREEKFQGALNKIQHEALVKADKVGQERNYPLFR